ncbi:MAG: hypothetical protein NT062_10495, partial [Proteobacteria bacterium]|nr:hypothetical protein [Pseudomonadota bacterium]
MRGPSNMSATVAFLLGILGILGLGGVASAAPRAQFRMDGQPHVDVPFELDLMVEGFGEAPVPELPTIAIADATVTPLGATPNVARSIQIVNGQRSESATVTWVLRYRVEVSKPGTMRVPSVFVQQGSERAIAAAGTVTVGTIPTTDDMKLALVLPDRPVFVGETVQAELVWLFRAQPEEQNFIVPLMASDVFTVTTPPIADKRTALSFTAGSKDIPVPYVSDTTTVGGVEFRRIRFTFFIAPHRAGKIEIPAAKVVAGLAVGRRDFFGNAATRPFRAVDVPRTIEVKPLPETGRPPAFTGAVGDQFSIAVKTSRSVVQLGEPMAVEITVKSNQRLDTLALGKLDGEGGLPKDKFAVPAEPPTGTLSDDGLAKTFELTAQVVGPATEIPANAFAYFDPAKAEYQTIHSDPIALSVKGGSIVGADAVVAATPRRAGSAATISEDLTLVPVELALSSGSADEPMSGAMLWLLVGLLYLAPLGIFGVRTWQLRTREAREDRAEVRTAKKKVLAELERARAAPAREAIGPLVGALRDLARALARDPGADGLIGKLETAAFAPSAADHPLADDLRAEIAKLVDQWSARPSLPRATAVATLLGL